MKAQNEEPVFGFSVYGGGDFANGFIQDNGFEPSGGLGLSLTAEQNWEGVFTASYYSFPGYPLTINQANGIGGSTTPTQVNPSGDLAFEVGAHYHLDPQWDWGHRRFKGGPYLLAALGMDFLFDQTSAVSSPSQLLSSSYDLLFSTDFGVGMEIPLDSTWLLNGECLDHLIFWDQLTQVLVINVGFKWMVDTAHADPLKGVF